MGRDKRMKRWVALVLAVAVAGCANEPPPPNGTWVTGQELKELITGATVYGGSYRRKQGFMERYHPDGGYEIAFSKAASSDDYGKTHRGSWRIEGNQVCYKVASLNSDGCAIIYRQHAQIEFVSPESGKATFFSYEIEYEGKKPPSTAEVPVPPAAPSPPKAPPPTAAIPSPPMPPPAPVAPAPSTPRPVATPQPVAPPTASKPASNLRPIASGSGFIVSNQTFVLTNEHVIQGCVEITARIDDRDVRAIVRARDKRNDLALLRLPAGKYPVAVFRGNDGLYPGDSVVAIGYPLSDILASQGTVSVGAVSALAGIGNNASLLQISTPIQPGNSGGPLLDMSGHVVGVIVSGLGKKFFEADGTLPQNVNFAIKSTVATAFMQASGVEYKIRNSAKELRPADVARKGRPATVPIHCWG